MTAPQQRRDMARREAAGRDVFQQDECPALIQEVALIHFSPQACHDLAACVC